MFGFVPVMMNESGGGGAFLVSTSLRNNGSNDTTLLVINQPADIQAGDLLIAVVGRNVSTNWTETSGNWTREEQTAGAITVAVFYKIATSSEPSTYIFVSSFGGSGSSNGGAVLVFRKAQVPIVGTGTDANPMTASGITMTSPGKLLTAFFSTISSPAAPDGTDVISESVGNTYINWRIGMEEVAAGATGSRTSPSSGAGLGHLIGIGEA